MELALTSTPLAAPTSAVSYEYLERREDVLAVAEQVRSDGIMGLDTEFELRRTYFPQLALLQVSTRDAIYIIDPLVEHDTEDEPIDQPIWDAMADPNVRTVVHAHKFESQFCVEFTGQAPGDLFDTQIAAGFNGYHYPIGYSKLILNEYGVEEEKSQARTNWLKRPLRLRQKNYAAGDVRWLIPLHDDFQARMQDDPAKTPRLSWMTKVAEEQIATIDGPPLGKLSRVSNFRALSPQPRAVLEELFHWRDNIARANNVPATWLMEDTRLVGIAKAAPNGRDAVVGYLRSHRFSRPPWGSPHWRTFWDAINVGLSALVEDETPAEEEDARLRGSREDVNRLIEALRQFCESQDISWTLVGNRERVRELVLWHRDGEPADRIPDLLSGWRRELLGEYVRPILAAGIRESLPPVEPQPTTDNDSASEASESG